MWFEEDVYEDATALPEVFNTYPELSLVRVYDNGKTQPGWGRAEFEDTRETGAFEPSRALRFYEKYGDPFAVVMRSVPFICVDIDGKNGGIQTAQALELPPTLAERSKSGNGYHLFYQSEGFTSSDTYDAYPDLIGLIPGVDIKAVGLVFHYPNQRWNSREMSSLPPSLAMTVTRRAESRRTSKLTKYGVSALDPDDLAMLHSELLSDLWKPIRAGTRNNTLFRMGARMHAAGYAGWEIELSGRGQSIGLDADEIDDIIRSVLKYT